MGVKIVMTKDYPHYNAGESLEVSEERAERWVYSLAVAKYADKRKGAQAPNPAPKDGD